MMAFLSLLSTVTQMCLATMLILITIQENHNWEILWPWCKFMGGMQGVIVVTSGVLLMGTILVLCCCQKKPRDNSVGVYQQRPSIHIIT